ncbi:tetratricopeptide repeat protein [Sutcliffiella horikoshii]|uniref:tetratricopeptide repeat protein n=1 Tax=Sutcliffiella horikoshii TaxID=79883 RepID=UPI001CBAB6C6|nr:tetratricopeptide repeat protein [Sutcliffiella horikoshii]UAL46379.1 tetratricopeptide repeat protein [Sutcliffiella horikoshii]
MKKEKKIVEFPNLKQRLLEKAMQTMKEKKFSEALELFEQARENEYAYAEVELGMVVCYMELGQLTEARNRCKKMLREDIGDYFHVLQIYITILIQLKEYDEVKTTIEAILEEDKLPAQYAQNFYQLLEFARKMLPSDENAEQFEPEYGQATDDIDELNMLHDGPIQKQYELIQSLKHRNIRPLIPDIQKYLEDERKHPVLKTFLLHILKEQGWDKETEVIKMGQRITIVPTELNSGEEDPFLNKVISILEDTVESDNPSLFEGLKEMLVRIHTVQFPLPFTPDKPEVWAAGLHSAGVGLFGLEASDEEIAAEYNVSALEVKSVTREINKLEDFSYLRL